MTQDSDPSRPGTGAEPAEWLFRVDRAVVRWDWANGVPPIRRLSPRRLPRATALASHSPTHVYSYTVGGHMLVESGLERELVEELDGDPNVVWMVTQPVELHFRHDRRLRRHVPDLLVETSDGLTVWDARPEPRQSARFLEVAQWTRRSCHEVGWGYQIFSGHTPQRRVNALWLSAYRRPPVVIEAYATVIRDGLQDGSITTVGDVAERDTGYGQLLAAMYHLLWSHRLTCDLEIQITGETRLSWVR